jgi:enoyl-CoA hydratase / 3-hydroxyacyl-CoA dehydrogenase
MAFQLAGRTVGKVAVIGSGQIGPDIAFHFSKALCRQGVPVVVVDVEQAAVEKGAVRVRGKLDKGVAARAFKPEVADAIFGNITFTTDYAAIEGADFVVEAATEDLAVKRKIVEQVESLVPGDAIIASNSSHMEPEVIFDAAKKKERTLVVHYFFPAERNLVVEIVPGADTHPALGAFLMDFYEQTGKVPIRVGSRYGYAVDPVFEGLFQAAALCVEEGLCDVKQADAIAQKALGLGVGPFTAMNLTGGNPITQHGLKGMHDKIGEWFGSPKILDHQVAAGTPWPTAGRDEEVEYSDKAFALVSARLHGAFFGLVGEIIDAGISNVADMSLAVELGLAMRSPFAVMNRLGIGEALRLVEEYAMEHDGFPVPACLREQAATGMPWDVPVVIRRDVGDVAVVTIRRPRVLNALNADVVRQLAETFYAIREDRHIRAAVLTGFGVKAFVSGADIRELAALKGPEEAIALSARGQGVLNGIERLGKPVVAAMNGLAFGGGNELAMACTCRIASAGQRILAGQPEPNLGIIPGFGGTQRLPRLIGMERAWPLLRNGRPFSSADAAEWGLILKEVPGPDLVDEAIRLAREIASGKTAVPSIPTDPIPYPDDLPDVDLGHLSTRIDEILRKAAIEGAQMNLYQGLIHEANLFGECLITEDTRIGMKNFLENGPKSKAEFKNS